MICQKEKPRHIFEESPLKKLTHSSWNGRCASHPLQASENDDLHFRPRESARKAEYASDGCSN